MVSEVKLRTWISTVVAMGVALAACSTLGPDKPDYLRVVVDIDDRLKVPTDIDQFKLAVEREGVPLFNENYDQTAIAKLPDSLIIDNPHPNNDSPDTQLWTLKPIYIKLVGYSGGKARIWRTVRVKFNRGQSQLGLPLCWDCLDHECPAEQTCISGSCVDWDSAQRASDEEPLIQPLKECSP